MNAFEILGAPAARRDSDTTTTSALGAQTNYFWKPKTGRHHNSSETRPETVARAKRQLDGKQLASQMRKSKTLETEGESKN